MLRDLIHPPENSNNRNNSSSKALETEKKGAEMNRFNQPAIANDAIYANHGERLSDSELIAICRRACRNYPSVDPDRLCKFLVVADDPEWQTERIAKHIARRMSEGLIIDRD